MTIAPIVRIVVNGRTWQSGQHDNVDDAKRMLLEALTSCTWPTTNQAKFIVTPGGFVRIPFQFEDIKGGWESEHHFDLLKVPGTDAVKRLLTKEVLHYLVDRAKFLTIGIDLNNTDDKFSDETHAELVALVDVRLGEVVHWTGKSYPTMGKNDQSRTLVQAPPQSHCFAHGRDQVLILGCHDLYMFGCRGRPSASKLDASRTHKERRRAAMLELAQEFEPRIVLHHPHTTYSPRIWQSAWGALRKRLTTVQSWASGIAFCGKSDCSGKWERWQTIDKTCDATRSEDVLDVTVDGFECHVETKRKRWMSSH